MSLEGYFRGLIERVENSSQVTNKGKDANGFFLPTRTVLLRHLNVLKDLHSKPRAKPMLQAAWKFVVENVPPEWLILTPDEKTELKKILD